MAGYRRPKKTYLLKFADPAYNGLQVEMHGLSIRLMLRMTTVATELVGTGDKRDEAAEELFRTFASKLIRWNLEDDDGQPVPPTYEGIADQDLEFTLDLVMGWIEAVTSPDPTSPASSPTGQPPEDLNLATASSSLPG